MAEIYKILVIDDDDVDRQAVRRALRDSDFVADVREAADAAQAIRLLKSDHFDCALLDYLLPDRDGLSVISELRGSGVSTPLIVMTGQGSEQLAVDLMKAGANDYLSKSRVSLGHLAQAIRAAVRIHRAETLAALTDEKLHEEMRITETLYRLASRLVAERELSALVQIVTDEATALVGAQFGAFFDHINEDHDGGFSLSSVCGAEDSNLRGVAASPIGQMLSLIFRGGASVRIDDALADPRCAPVAALAHLTPERKPIRSCLAVPVISRSGAILGGMLFAHTDAARFDARDERLTCGIAAQAAVAIDNARLYQALRSGEEQYRFLSESIPQMVWTAWPDGGSDYFNLRWIEFTGRSLEKSLGTQWVDVVHPDDARRCVDRWRAAVREGRIYEIELRLRRRDGAYRWHLIRAVPMRDDQGALLKWFGTATDIHDQKLTERALQQAKESAEAANHAKDQFLAVLSHELRTPLTPVLSTVQALELSRQAPELQTDLSLIRRNVELEARLIDDLLDLTRISRGKVQLNFETVDVHASVRAALDICQSDIDAKCIRVRLTLNARQRFVHADPARLQQVIWNIVKNAVKFTPDQGEISVTTEDSNGHLRIGIRDTGIGIDPQSLPRIFDAFEQAERTISRHFGGLGLGLAISKALVDLHHGVITADSAGENQGTTFTIELPVVAVEQAQPQAVPDQQSEDRQIALKRILLVDDHADTNRAMKRLLERLGYEVATADSVASAIAAAEHNPFDLLISDIGLPDGSGLQLIKELSKRRPVRGIALSGFGMEEDVRKSRAAGFQDHLTKPINLTRLETALRKLSSRT
jgi:PAS domain S-box-containing protein